MARTIRSTFTDSQGEYHLFDRDYHSDVSAVHIAFEKGHTEFLLEVYDDVRITEYPGWDVGEPNVPEAAAVFTGTDGIYVEGINATLEPATFIRGTVVSQQGLALEGIDVRLVDDLWDQTIQETETNIHGQYELQAQPGLYRIQFGAEQANYSSEWYENADWITDATIITHTGLADTSNIDATLEPLGSISGQISDSAGASLAGFTVLFEGLPGGIATLTDDHGRFSVTAPTGRYRMYVYGTPATGNDPHPFLGKYYKDTYDEDEAQGSVCIGAAIGRKRRFATGKSGQYRGQSIHGCPYR